ncbi:Gfo/Idh/MocA family oxidoreductase [Blastopirellula sp. J2-11]|uniref:Gfo/Idh/MocA family protein n=1 Tax=Blastopirellula sp. J2-11 TaxID=2943192 RepID=UPI0021C88B23|nr:Gfo/Idh/MocA family oxidoreductase [Blastopirellula sp. J2-11]UUO07219.1 Gfo/Idh/MocA family oxidoreductase [Blastopirellula sp. J2-11]
MNSADFADRLPASGASPVTRRSFLQATGGLAAGAGLLSPSSLHAAESKPKKVRVGIVGGRFGLGFQFHEHPLCEVTGVAELRPERLEALSKTYKCETKYDSLEAMLAQAKDMDAVAIFTPAPDHVRHSVAALNAGKHVLCAVPAAMNLEECEELIETVKRTGLSFMMAETSYWQQSTISARQMYQEGKFGNLIYCESEYQHDGLDSLFHENGKRTWRYGFPPMNYPTHCTAHYVGVTGERLTEVMCQGWGDDSPSLKDNAYNNPFWNESAMFKTESGLAFNVRVWWKGAHRGGERAEWIGDKMSFYGHTPNGQGPVIIRSGQQTEKDDAGFVRSLPAFEQYQIPEFWKTDMLPAPLRHGSGHEGSHPFITNEFIDAVANNRRPAVDVYEAVAFTAPGIVAHQSALKGGEQLKVPNFGRAS